MPIHPRLAATRLLVLIGFGETVLRDFAIARRRHNVVFDDGRSSDTLDAGARSTAFAEPGTYAYRCTLHTRMTGDITVVGS